ncbi:hypothetical protein [Kitasatospora sp. NPDC090091]|uniref:hypothetical protein n=1 Tax=Kitasatospora sp. NPDC090091 TaxID=3364081 RepID=UPI003822D180
MTERGRPFVLAAAWPAFLAIAVVVAAHDWRPFAFEQAAVDRCVAHRPPAARTAAMAVTSLGTGVAPYLLALAAGVIAARTTGSPKPRRTVVRVLLLPVVWLALGQLLRQGLMHAFGRPRPPETDWAFTASGFAFPSGHAFTSALCAGLLALAVARARPVRIRDGELLAFGLALRAWSGVSRAAHPAPRPMRQAAEDGSPRRASASEALAVA